MANTYLNRTSIGTPTNRKKFTGSAWVKRARASGTEAIIWTGSDSNNWTMFKFTNSNLLAQFRNSSSDVVFLQTNRVFRDTSSWYHIVCAVDTTQATASDRVKLYVNGVQETSFSTATYPSQNLDLDTTTEQKVGLQHTTQYFDGSMSHVHFTDGTTYDASAFGETDATTGEWVGKTSPSVTYGNNGFFILKDGNGITDQSGEGNNFTLGGGTLTNLKDNPDNVFATLNSLNSWGLNVLSNTNLTITNTGTDAAHTQSTLHMNNGKWYMEFNIDAHGSGGSAPMFILAGTGAYQQKQIGFSASGDGAYGIGSNGRSITDGAESGSVVFTELTAGDKVQIAFDADAGKAWFGVNGTYLGSGNPSTGANPYFTTTKLQNNDVSLTIVGYGTANKASCNFGNGYFGTTAITTNSGNGYAGAEGASKFNYTVPTGYSALSTKGLNE
jgi:hypothetical protein